MHGFFRRLVNGLVALLPARALAYLFKVFEMRPELAAAAGYSVYPKVFYSPIPYREELNMAALKVRRHLPDIEFNLNEGLKLIEKLKRYSGELQDLPQHRIEQSPFWFDNNSFTDFDAVVLHCLLRHIKPRQYIEVGAGFSSYISSRAIRMNRQEGSDCDPLYIDPEPRRDMKEVLNCGRLIQKKVQDAGMDLFTRLKEDDVLFIDTTHILKLQSDVVYEFLEILPSLAPGVWIHVHDIFTPYDYPEDWLNNPIPFACNEQYALEALLSGGDRYRVILPLFLLWKEH
jgi:hypothetical protein